MSTDSSTFISLVANRYLSSRSVAHSVAHHSSPLAGMASPSMAGDPAAVASAAASARAGLAPAHLARQLAAAGSTDCAAHEAYEKKDALNHALHFLGVAHNGSCAKSMPNP